MGHKVSTVRNDGGTSSTTTAFHPRRRNRAAFSILAMTLATATCCDSFTSPPLFTSSASASPEATAKGHRRSPFAFPRLDAAAATATIAASPPRTFLPEPKQQQQQSRAESESRNWNFSRPTLFRRRKQQEQQQEEEYERRKHEWAATYTCVNCLRDTFGDNTNKLWGDLDASTCRRLYKTLLPRALLELYRLGLPSEDLAPLAFKARVAAKLYARERCRVPARLWAMWYDGLRAWKKYNRFQVTGMSYDQVWDKYEQEIMQEIETTEGLTEEDVTAKICLRILERSCTTNAGVDKLFLRESDAKAMEEQSQDISNVTQQLERDVRAILNPKGKTANAMTAQRVKALRMVVRAKRRLERLQLLEDEKKKQAEHKEKQSLEEDAKIVYPWNARANKMDGRERPWEHRHFPSRRPRH